MLKSIYNELLEYSEQQTYNTITLDGFYQYGEEDDEEDDGDMEVLAPEDQGVNGNLIYMPFERTFLCVGDNIEIEIEDLKFTILNVNLPDTMLRKYIDGGLYRQYPIAVSFTISREDYVRYTKELVSKDIAVLSYRNGSCHSFEDGTQIFDCSLGDDRVKMVMGFAKEGVGTKPLF